MLLNFRVANFRAFRDPQEFTMRRARGLSSKTSPGDWDANVSPIAVIYGPNASGKSTLYRAMSFVRRAVNNSYRRWPVDGGVPGATPFLLDQESANNPCELEIEFIARDGIRYQYGFQVSTSRVEAEWLYSYKSSSRSTLFERNSADLEPLYFGNSFRGNRTAIEEALTQRPNALFISVAAQLGNKVVASAHKWLTNSLRTYDARQYEAEHRHLVELLRKDDAARQQLSEVLAKADLGTNLTVAENEVDPAMFERAYEAVRILADDDAPTLDADDLAKLVDSASHEIQFLHRSNDEEVAFPLGWESDGTQALLSFASVAMKTLRTGSTMIVDEIDSSLHPVIVAELIRVFRDNKTNPLQAQLVVTTHDATLLNAQAGDTDLLDRDQVWVTEKNLDGSSSLTASSEDRTPRKDENLMRGYLSGRYGGVPMPSIFEAICAIQQDA